MTLALLAFVAVAVVLNLLVSGSRGFAEHSGAEPGALPLAVASKTEGVEADAALPVPDLVREPVGAEAAASLVFCDRETGAPVAAETVRLRFRGGGAADEVSLGAGVRVEVPSEGATDCCVWVAAPGYVTLAGWIRLEASGEHRLGLQRGGTVRATITDGAGAAVAGAKVVLLPPWHVEPTPSWVAIPGILRDVEPSRLPELRPRDGVLSAEGAEWSPDGSGRLDAAYAGVSNWSRESDARGELRWEDVPASPGYRWGLMPPQHGSVEPPHEQQRFAVVGDKIQVGKAPPRGLSGAFCVDVGGEVALTGVVRAGGRVTGHLDPGPLSAEPAVRLYRVVQVSAGEGGPAVTAFEFEATGSAGERPPHDFVFDGIAPGLFVVRASWMVGERDLYFANQTFKLQPGADLDLGLVPTLAGPGSVTVRVGVAENGKAIAARDVFGDEQLFARTSIEIVPDHREVNHTVYELLAMRMEREFVLHGLPAGRLIARAQPLGGVSGADAVAGVTSIEDAVFDGRWDRLSDTLRLDLEIERGVTRHLRIARDRDGALVPVSAVWARRDGAAEVRSVAAEIRTVAGVQVSSVTLPAGDYDIAVSVADDGREGATGWFGKVRVRFAGDAAAECADLLLGQGAAVSGRVPDPSATRVLEWRDAGPSREHGGWPYVAAVGDDGSFTLRGIPPGTRLRGVGAAPDIPPLRAGAVLDLAAR